MLVKVLIMEKLQYKKVIFNKVKDYIKDKDMEIISVEILNPKAAQLLKDLADLNLIAIKDKPSTGFASVLKKMRSKATSAPTLEEITREVETVRTKRYEKNNH